ncbi:DUF402 domain-containing protein [Ktedonosporobacter rubrisoli]|uniref:DUF402 domain-containing protein n=1 Tax=Ktedonosporobacter rubrisoli TaxID=2509675 RepID=A0A4P6K280_KTERU|nr:DUF402 domain-containing protein [Ktedonosporobacter rubrisoli]QBD81810.1 DUF402 domain-containing protein [Ktedonosporobacter rubrisoli]
MKHKRADRADWQRIIRKRFAMMSLEERDFKGYVTLFCIDALRKPLWRDLQGERVCLADNGYHWLQHFPRGEHYALTSIFNEQGEFVRGYVDICKQYYLDAQGALWYDDLYLDLDVAPSGSALILDAEELDSALGQDEVSPLEYELAWRALSSIMTAIEADAFPLLSTYGLIEEHRDRLLKLLEPAAY